MVCDVALAWFAVRFCLQELPKAGLDVALIAALAQRWLVPRSMRNHHHGQGTVSIGTAWIGHQGVAWMTDFGTQAHAALEEASSQKTLLRAEAWPGRFAEHPETVPGQHGCARSSAHRTTRAHPAHEQMARLCGPERTSFAGIATMCMRDRRLPVAWRVRDGHDACVFAFWGGGGGGLMIY